MSSSVQLVSIIEDKLYRDEVRGSKKDLSTEIHYLRKRCARGNRDEAELWHFAAGNSNRWPAYFHEASKQRERKNGIDNRRGKGTKRTGGKKRADWFFAVGQLIWRERERGREQKREKEFTAAEWSIVGRARPFDDCQLEKYSNSITIFFVRSHTPNRGRIWNRSRLRREIHSSSAIGGRG